MGIPGRKLCDTVTAGMIGAVIGGRYRVEHVLGEGGMGCVYAARHTSTARLVALKVITSKKVTPDLVKRFHVEAKAAGLIESDHVAQVLDMGMDDERGTPFLALELLRGEDLRAVSKRLGALPPGLALRIAAQVLRGLAKAHERAILHRDIKPANIFIAERDDGRRVVKLLDFGIAKIRGDQELLHHDDQNITSTGAMLGTPLYMSPEQTKGLKRTDERTDLWALGVVLYELLSGVTPHPDAEALGDLIFRICTVSSHVRKAAPWVPVEVAAIVDKALAIEPEARWQSSEAMLAAIRRQLPDGIELTTDMLVPLGDAERGSVSPDRAAEPETSADGRRGAATTAATSSARSDVASATRAPRSVPFIVGAAVVTVAIGVTALAVFDGSRSPPEALRAPSSLDVAPPRGSDALGDRPTPSPRPDVAVAARPTADVVASGVPALSASSAGVPSSPPSGARRPASGPPSRGPSAAPSTTPQSAPRDPRREL